MDSKVKMKTLSEILARIRRQHCSHSEFSGTTTADSNACKERHGNHRDSFWKINKLEQALDRRTRMIKGMVFDNGQCVKSFIGIMGQRMASMEDKLAELHENKTSESTSNSLSSWSKQSDIISKDESNDEPKHKKVQHENTELLIGLKSIDDTKQSQQSEPNQPQIQHRGHQQRIDAMEQKLNEISVGLNANSHKMAKHQTAISRKVDQIAVQMKASKSNTDRSSDRMMKLKQSLDRETKSMEGTISENEQSTKLMIDAMGQRLDSMEQSIEDIMKQMATLRNTSKMDNDQTAERILKLEQTLNEQAIDCKQRMDAVELKMNKKSTQIEELVVKGDRTYIEMMKFRTVQSRMDTMETVMNQITDQNASLSELVQSLSTAMAETQGCRV